MALTRWRECIVVDAANKLFSSGHNLIIIETILPQINAFVAFAEITEALAILSIPTSISVKIIKLIGFVEKRAKPNRNKIIKKWSEH